MKSSNRGWIALASLCAAVLAASLGLVQSAAAQAARPFSAIGNVVPFAGGLQYPRGLKFGPDGKLYVAEAGEGPTTLPAPADCELAGPVVRPYTSALTGGRISRVDANGARTTVADSFPRAVNGLGDALGVADIEFIDGTMYALVASGGCSHAVTSVPSGVARVNPNSHESGLHPGSWKTLRGVRASAGRGRSTL